MTRILSCDWGTSSFRLKLVDVTTGEVTATQHGDEGISVVYARWKEAGSPVSGRTNFYVEVLRRHIELLEKTISEPLDGLPLVISGMASSSIGLRELPYARLPFRTDGSDLVYERMALPDFPHEIIFVSGAQSDDDVMRGEEVQLTGAVHRLKKSGLYIFPGTHSKHIVVEGNMAVSCKTYMTGEFFHLLSEKSVLSNSIRKEGTLEQYRQLFHEGVRAAFQTNILNSSFYVRSLTLLEKRKPEENYYYLSGLLIGSEISSLQSYNGGSIILVGSDALTDCYRLAFESAGIPASISCLNGDEAVTAGHICIYQRSQENPPGRS